jgi:hypothetical protein
VPYPDSIERALGERSLQDTLESYNGIDVNQRREYVKISCQSYLTRMLKTNGWDKPSPTEKSDSKPIEALAASTTEELSTLIGPTEGTTENGTLEKEIGLSYRQVRPCTVRPGRGAGQIALVRLLFWLALCCCVEYSFRNQQADEFCFNTRVLARAFEIAFTLL